MVAPYVLEFSDGDGFKELPGVRLRGVTIQQGEHVVFV